MVLIRSQLAVLGLALALSGSLVACGDDDPPMNGGDGDGDGDSAGDGDGDGDMGGPYDGIVVESTDITAPVAGKTVRLFNPETGEFYPGEEVSDAQGNVHFDERPANAGTFVLGGGEQQDTWNFPPARKGEEQLIRVGAVTSATAVPVLANYPTEQDASPIAGSVLWHNDATNVDEFVGCATIDEADGVKDVRYFDGDLPTSLAMRSAEAGTQPPDGNGGNDGEAGKYFIGNVQGGMRTITARINGEVVGSRTFYVTPRSEGTEIPAGENGALVPSNLSLGSIYVNESFTENPTPADCD